MLEYMKIWRKDTVTLKDLELGKSCIVTKVLGEGQLRQHLLDMGVIPGVKLTLIKYAPLGDPMELLIHNYVLTLRLDDALKIEVVECKDNNDFTTNNSVEKNASHPGFGEEGIYHDKKKETPLDKGVTLSFALAGNQNSGKTTLFNQLTGSNQHVGNFPGVTVDRKSGVIKGYPSTLVTDLPGIYSLSPYTAEEIVSRQFILDEKPKGIINIVDATNIERNLYLTLQLLELDIPLVVALNMMDEVRGNGGSIYINKMEEILGVPVVPIAAAKNEGVKELVEHAVHVAKYQEKPLRTDFCSESDNGGAVHRCIHAIMHLIEDHAKNANIPLRFAATKVIEGDKLVVDSLKLTQNEKEMIEHIIIQMEEERGLDRAASIADMRFSFIMSLCEKTVVKPKESIEHIRSKKIDKILTGKYTAIPSFILIMGLIFFFTFGFFGKGLQELLENGINLLTNVADNALTKASTNEVLHSLIIDGIFKGIGSILSFLPVIIILFFNLSILEDSGYMARVAFVMDKILRKIGLSGRSIVPMLIGFGCTVPGVMATRTLPSKRDRKMTVLLTPFMSCTAKIPIYSFFCLAFFPAKYSWLIIIALYLIGIIVGVIVALIGKNTIFKGEAVPFVMELPNYRIPGIKNVMQLLWDKAKDFLKRAFTIIFIASIIIWFLQSFNFSLVYLSKDQTNQSILAHLSSFISPIFALQGFGDWRIVTSLIAGFMAKESVVSTLTLLLGTTSITSVITPLSAFSLLVFCLLYTPCIASIASIKRELGRGWSVLVVVFQCAIAWICSLIVTLMGLLVGLI